MYDRRCFLNGKDPLRIMVLGTEAVDKVLLHHLYTLIMVIPQPFQVISGESDLLSRFWGRGFRYTWGK